MNDIYLFTLFHHYCYPSFVESNNIKLFDSGVDKPIETIESISDKIQQIVKKNIDNNHDDQISLTLTGGMDSRIILACLLKLGVKPNCLVYGNAETGDVIYAQKLAKAFDLKFHNAVSTTPTKDWYYHWVVETIKRDKGNAHLHRAHRTAAIAEHVEKHNPQILFTGHMGGEGLRGLTYNNYFASPFFELVNEGKMDPKEAAQKVLHDYFIDPTKVDMDNLLAEINELSWMKHDKQTNKYYFLYDLVAKVHHAQDLRLYESYVSKVVPVFIQKEYLDALFASPFNFLNKKQGVMGRLNNPYIYCKMLEHIYPDLLEYPLANGFSPKEYLKGLWYYVPVKLYRNFRFKKNYPPSFSYGKWYVDFVKEHSANIDPVIWEFYDKKRYMHALGTNTHETNEGYWHKFSNPIYFDLVRKYKEGLL